MQRWANTATDEEVERERADKRRVEDLRANGWTEDQIAKELGISRPTLRARYGQKTNRKAIAAKRREIATRLRAQGWSCVQIARELGVTQQSVSQMLKVAK